MSNFLAIATVTETLKQMLDATVGSDVPGANAIAAKPSESGEKGVNIYLYQVGPNASWRNDDLPTRRSDGTLVKRPRAALDLYYLLTFYGDEAHLEPQRILGSVVAALHAQPVLSRSQIQEAIKHAENGFLNGSNLGEEIELVKFIPMPLSLEELNNLWSGFFQIPYSLSMAYQASVVFIEGKEIARSALPVRDRNLYTISMRQPIIEEVTSEQGEDQSIVAGSRVIIRGQNLRGDMTCVLIGGIKAQIGEVLEDKISATLPASLRAGIQSVQVIHQMMMGTPPEPHRGGESNVAAFVLRPTISIPEGTKIINVNPQIGKGQRVVLFLNEINGSAEEPPAAYTFVLPLKAEATDEVDIPASIPIGDVKAGEYLVRVGVDGAQSILVVEDDTYAGPKVAIG